MDQRQEWRLLDFGTQQADPARHENGTIFIRQDQCRGPGESPDSLLARVRTLIAARRSVCTLLRGRTFAVAGDNEAVHVRCVGDGVEFVVTAHNLSGRKQNIELRFDSNFQAEMSELLDNGAAVEVREQLSLSLPAYGYRWFRGARLHR